MTKASQAALGLISAYKRHISPSLGARCRYSPTCSEYASESIARFGLGRGTYLALRRLARCNPLHTMGVDRVPERFSWRHTLQSDGSTR